MNNQLFINKLSDKVGCSPQEASAIARYIAKAVVEEWQSEGCLCVPEFGNFEVKKKMECVSIDSETRQRVLIPPKLVLNFKPSLALKARMKKS